MPKSFRKVILHADDFGFNDDTTAATIACFKDGLLTSATIMAAMPATKPAIAFARAHPEFSFGAHLVFVDERPLLDPAQLPTLTDREGRFLPTRELRKRALLGKISIEDVEREMEAQLGLLRDCGVPLSHVDSHGHTHKLGTILRAFETVLPRFGIKRVRTAQNLFASPSLFRASRWMGRYWDSQIRRRWLTTDDFYMMSSENETLSQAQLDAMLLRGGVLEAGFHPGSSEAWRATEQSVLERFRNACRERGAQLITWNETGDT